MPLRIKKKFIFLTYTIFFVKFLQNFRNLRAFLWPQVEQKVELSASYRKIIEQQFLSREKIQESEVLDFHVQGAEFDPQTAWSFDPCQVYSSWLPVPLNLSNPALSGYLLRDSPTISLTDQVEWALGPLKIPPIPPQEAVSGSEFKLFELAT